MLRIHFRNSSRSPIWANKPDMTLGSDAKADVVLDADQPALLASLHTTSSDTTIIPADGVRLHVNKQPVPATGVALKAGDTITSGSLTLEVVDPLASVKAMQASVEKMAGTPVASKDRHPASSSPWKLVAIGGLLNGNHYPLAGKSVIGREAGVDIVIAGTHLSRKHAELTVKAGAIAVKDLNSANGTYINGKRISEGFLKNGDELRLDTLRFRVEGPADDKDRTVVASAIDIPSPIRNPDDIHWKTKPTSRGNNYKTGVTPAMDSINNDTPPVWPWVVGAIMVVGCAAAVVIFLM